MTPGRLLRPLWRFIKMSALALAAVAVLTIGAAIWGSAITRVRHPDPPPIVNDVTQLNPIAVSQVIAPTTVEEIVQAVKTHPGPISVGGGRYSMGGQTATPGALQIDMRSFNKILAFDSVGKTI